MKNRIAIIKEPFKVEIAEREVREMKDDEAIIAVRSASICGSDLHIYKGKHPAVKLPTTIGHEFSGEVIAIGKDNNNLQIGDRVTLEPIISCGHCPACLSGNYGLCENATFSYRIGDGAFADYVVGKTAHLFKLPASMSYDTGALIEPLAVANRAVKRSQVEEDNAVIIFGAGTIGLFITAILSAKGIRNITIVDYAAKRLEAALNLGAAHTINLADQKLEAELYRHNPKGYDTAFEVVGKAVSFNNALHSLRTNGTLLQVGIFEEPDITFNAADLINRQLKIIGTQGYNNDFPEAIALASAIDLEQLITHIYPLSQLQDAFECNLNAAKTGSIKVLIHPKEDDL